MTGIQLQHASFQSLALLVCFLCSFLLFFLTPSHPHPLVLITPPLPSSAPHSTHKHTQTDSSPPVSRPLRVLHPAINSLVYNAPRFLSVDNKMKRKQTKKTLANRGGFYCTPTGNLVISFSTALILKTSPPLSVVAAVEGLGGGGLLLY